MIWQCNYKCYRKNYINYVKHCFCYVVHVNWVRVCL
jgi:hypothetical protein